MQGILSTIEKHCQQRGGKFLSMDIITKCLETLNNVANRVGISSIPSALAFQEFCGQIWGVSMGKIAYDEFLLAVRAFELSKYFV